jgi:hypothetical protein
MKKLLFLLLIAPLFFISSCEEETQSGYDCISNTCTAVFESPQYLTLSDCQSACADNNGGNSNLEIGAIYQGGIVFYIDETGEHGLVAASEDLGEYQWGCYGTEISGADGTAIGTGYQNTLDIVAGCSESSAASETLIYESEGFDDWYLPSRDELVEMYNTIGYGGPEGNIGGFESELVYWSSSENYTYSAWFVSFSNGYAGNGTGKPNSLRVRAVRAF